ncbi:hypothetical protein B0H15DRAFT_955158 [Mycena belliarum]|uniref:Uncharacterized protein n=1 Tax=Mycena belliarum TaxID=1033014 RepID=A0AAD6TRV1_9AGAR|nr:hypothetical protein B0H15DRAFT_955158 [Mycena belliae]
MNGSLLKAPRSDKDKVVVSTEREDLERLLQVVQPFHTQLLGSELEQGCGREDLEQLPVEGQLYCLSNQLALTPFFGQILRSNMGETMPECPETAATPKLWSSSTRSARRLRSTSNPLTATRASAAAQTGPIKSEILRSTQDHTALQVVELKLASKHNISVAHARRRRRKTSHRPPSPNELARSAAAASSGKSTNFVSCSLAARNDAKRRVRALPPSPLDPGVPARFGHMGHGRAHPMKRSARPSRGARRTLLPALRIRAPATLPPPRASAQVRHAPSVLRTFAESGGGGGRAHSDRPGAQLDAAGAARYARRGTALCARLRSAGTRLDAATGAPAPKVGGALRGKQGRRRASRSRDPTPPPSPRDPGGGVDAALARSGGA